MKLDDIQKLRSGMAPSDWEGASHRTWVSANYVTKARAYEAAATKLKRDGFFGGWPPPALVEESARFSLHVLALLNDALSRSEAGQAHPAFTIDELRNLQLIALERAGQA